MELKHIKELMAAMGRTGTKRLTMKKDGFEIQLEREDYKVGKSVDSPYDLSDENLYHPEHNINRVNQALSRAKDTVGSLGSDGHAAAHEKDDIASSYVTSPMVGTFYAMPSPEDPAFVKVGDKIDKNTVVCIIEAMKVMNEVKAGVSGIVSEVLVENSHPVEFGTKLFKVTT